MKTDEYFEHMSDVTSSANTKEGYYLPHLAVISESSITTRLKIVFDAFAKT